MSRTLWFAAGAGVGLYAVTRARRAAEALSPDGLADRLSGLALGLHLFREEVRAGMDAKENEVRSRLAASFPGSSPELQATYQLTDQPADQPADQTADQPADQPPDQHREATD